MSVTEELLDSRRAFPRAQELLGGVPSRRLPGLAATGWHSNDVHPEAGSVAVVGRLSPLAGLVGDIVRVTVGTRQVFVLVLGARDVPVDLSLARRPFAALALLTTTSLSAIVEVV